MLGEGIVSFGVAVVTVRARNVKASPKIVCSSATLPSTCSAGGATRRRRGRCGSRTVMLLVGRVDAAELVDEVHVPRARAGTRRRSPLAARRPPASATASRIASSSTARSCVGGDLARRRRPRAPGAARAGAAGCRRDPRGTVVWCEPPCGCVRSVRPALRASLVARSPACRVRGCRSGRARP